MSGTRAISTTSRRELSTSFFSCQGKAPKEIHAILTETLACFLPDRAKDLSAHQYVWKQARKDVRDARDFNNIEMRDVIKFVSLQGKAPKEIHVNSDRNIGFVSFLIGLRTYQRPLVTKSDKDNRYFI